MHAGGYMKKQNDVRFIKLDEAKWNALFVIIIISTQVKRIIQNMHLMNSPKGSNIKRLQCN